MPGDTCDKPIFGETCFRNSTTLSSFHCGCDKTAESTLHCYTGGSNVPDMGECVCFMFWGMEYDPETGECIKATSQSKAFCGISGAFTLVDVVLFVVAMRTVFTVIGSLKTLKAFNARTSTLVFVTLSIFFHLLWELGMTLVYCKIASVLSWEYFFRYVSAFS